MYKRDLQHPSPALQEKLRALYGLARDKKIDLSFRPPFLNLLEKLGNPHLNLPPVIHVAGTNGKGSTLAFVRAILEEAGHSVHVYTSPHLIKFNERIVLGGQEIGDDALEPLIDEVIERNDGADITFFEITTALAFAAFARSPADYCLLEVGLGGRLDCTNIIPSAALTVISRIGMDHMEQLGNTLEEIAAEKAGIIKESTACIIGPQRQAVMDVLQSKAKEKNSPVIQATPAEGLMLGLKGDYQRYNAGLALAVAEALHIEQKYQAVGLRKAKWRARFQRLYFESTPHLELWLDGGHNADAAAALLDQIKNWQNQDDQPLHLVMGMMAHKDPKSFLEPLLGYAKTIHVLDIPYEADCLKATQLGKIFPDANFSQAESFETVLHDLPKDQNARVLIAGSLYLAGHVLEQLESK